MPTRPQSRKKNLFRRKPATPAVSFVFFCHNIASTSRQAEQKRSAAGGGRETGLSFNFSIVSRRRRISGGAQSLARGRPRPL
jgi:hypothetical protein